MVKKIREQRKYSKSHTRSRDVGQSVVVTRAVMTALRNRMRLRKKRRGHRNGGKRGLKFVKTTIEGNLLGGRSRNQTIHHTTPGFHSDQPPFLEKKAATLAMKTQLKIRTIEIAQNILAIPLYVTVYREKIWPWRKMH